jgi:hypothetical protein
VVIKAPIARKLSPGEAEDIARTQQFGPGPREWIGLNIGTGNTATNGSGRQATTS